MTSFNSVAVRLLALLLWGAAWGSTVQAAVAAIDASKAVVTPATSVSPSARVSGPGRTGLDDRVRTTADDAPIKAGKRNAPAKYLMRCWQYGRLVLEEPRDTLLTESPKVVTVSRAAEPGETMQLVDMVSSSCALSMAP